MITQTEAVKDGSRAVAVRAHTSRPSAPASSTDSWDTPILGGPDGLGRVLGVLPKREADDSPTHGQLFRESGRPVPHGRLRSSRDPNLLADLDLPWKAERSEAMASHVEAKAAKMMRDGKAPQHAVLVIDNVDGPCGWLAGRLVSGASVPVATSYSATCCPPIPP